MNLFSSKLFKLKYIRVHLKNFWDLWSPRRIKHILRFYNSQICHFVSFNKNVLKTVIVLKIFDMRNFTYEEIKSIKCSSLNEY